MNEVQRRIDGFIGWEMGSIEGNVRFRGQVGEVSSEICRGRVLEGDFACVRQYVEPLAKVR